MEPKLNQYTLLLPEEHKLKTMTVYAGDVSDGHHTMDELYEHRHHLWLALTKVYDSYITPLECNIRCWKSKKHNDGSSYDGWFILGMTVVKHKFDGGITKEDLSYHLPMKYWDVSKVVELEKAPPYDGHTSKDVLERLLRL